MKECEYCHQVLMDGQGLYRSKKSGKKAKSCF